MSNQVGIWYPRTPKTLELNHTSEIGKTKEVTKPRARMATLGESPRGGMAFARLGPVGCALLLILRAQFGIFAFAKRPRGKRP